MKSLFVTLALVIAMAKAPAPPVEDRKPDPAQSKYPFQVELWNKAEIRPEWGGRVDGIVARIKANQARYERISERCDVPWDVVAALHNMECSGSFRKHIHEGSSLARRTRWIPKNRPKVGTPPFTFEESCYDSLVRLKKFNKVNWSDLGVTLQSCEIYNGLGYQLYRDIHSPYLHSGTNNYRKGKYASDGKYDSNLVSKQVGIVPILKTLRQ